MRHTLLRLLLAVSPLSLVAVPLSARADTIENYTINFTSWNSFSQVGTGTITVDDDGFGDYTVTGFSYSFNPGDASATMSYDSVGLSNAGVSTSFVNFDPGYGLAFSSASDPLYVYYSDGTGWELTIPAVVVDAGFYTITPDVTATPEPGSLALLGTGVLGAAGILRRRFIQA